ATYGEEFTLWTNTYNRSFMKFAGWSVGDSVYKNSATVRLDDIMAVAGDSNNDRIVFGMSWIDNEYQVQYNLDGGEGHIPVDDNAYVVNKTQFALAEYSEDFYRDGYSFIGWKYSESSYIVYTNTTGLFETVLAQYADGNNIVTFYAVWSQKSYKISYDLAGGRAGLNSPTNVFYGDEVRISVPTRAGYDFKGWTATGLTGGALYSSSAGYRGWDGIREVTSTSFMDLCNVDGGVVTMTAHWEQATYLITHHLNGGTGVVVSNQIEIRIGDVIQQPTLRDANKTGYRYIGWGADSVNALPVGATFTTDMVSDEGNILTLYAIWTPVEYVVQYRYIDTFAYSTLNVEFAETITIPMLDRSGYTFKGWQITGADANAYYSKDGSTWYKLGTTNVEGLYFKNLTSVDGGVVTMEAVWVTNEYRISYNSNGGTGKTPVDNNVYRVGDIVQLQDYTVLSGTNGSKSIVGWSLEANGSSVIIVEFTEGLAMQADATGAINLYAVWVDGMCTVVVDLGDATISMVPAGWLYNINGTYEKIVDYGTTTKDVMADWENVTIEKEGYNFTGWSYSSATITSTVTVDPLFEEVNMSVLYVFGGVIATFVVGAVIFTRL
ncbi:MAG: InlB B-repeat-containing protein, partial [Candidatus Methanomethylophilaceae archaeon]|nr:InlB B-repeat-containing protein [Candidatus Methanomethylophilaceae archaeon]